MQVNWFNISIILVLIVIDFYLQKKINEDSVKYFV